MGLACCAQCRRSAAVSVLNDEWLVEQVAQYDELFDGEEMEPGWLCEEERIGPSIT